MQQDKRGGWDAEGDFALAEMVLEEEMEFHELEMRMCWSLCVCVCVCVSVLSHVQLFCDPMDCSPPGSSAHGVFQARILEWVAISYSPGPS